MPDSKLDEKDTDDDLDVDLDGADGTGDGPDEDEKAAGQPPVKLDGKPYTQADIEALQTALRKSRRDVRAARKGGAQDPKAGDDKDGDADKVRADAESAATAKWKPTVVRTAARAAFAEAGLVLPKGKADTTMSRVLRMLDMDEIEINDEGDVEGLAEQIDEIKADCPDLFRTEERRRTTRLDVSDRQGGASKKPSSSDLIAAQLLGTGR